MKNLMIEGSIMLFVLRDNEWILVMKYQKNEDGTHCIWH